jgi:hypothetical protein
MMNELSLALGCCALALCGACGDSTGGDTGNGSETASSTVTAGDESGTGSGSASQTASASSSSTASGATEDSGSSGDTATGTTAGTMTTSTTESGSSGSGSGSSGSDTSMECSADQESCASGEMCCAGLECCAGVPIPPGQEYCSAGSCPESDRNKKENFASVDPASVLATVATLPITTWNYTSEDPSVRHIGPMAQDFKAAFGVGATDKAIFQVDADGVVLVSIQALHAELQAVRSENDDLRTRLAKLEAAIATPTN